MQLTEGQEQVLGLLMPNQVTMATMLDRESRREKILSAIQKEARLKVLCIRNIQAEAKVATKA